MCADAFKDFFSLGNHCAIVIAHRLLSISKERKKLALGLC